MTILAAIQWVQDEMLEISNMSSAPDYPDSIVLPGTIVHLSSGMFSAGNPIGATKELCEITLEIHIAESGGTSSAFAALEVFHPLILEKLAADRTLGGNITTYKDINYSTLRGTLDGVPVLSRIYTINECKLYS